MHLTTLDIAQAFIKYHQTMSQNRENLPKDEFNMTYDERKKLGHKIMDLVYSYGLDGITEEKIKQSFSQVNERVIEDSLDNLEKMQFIWKKFFETQMIIIYRKPFERIKRHGK